MMKRLWDWVLSLFVDEYVVDIYFTSESLETDKGLKTTAVTKKTYHFKSIKWKTQKHLVGVDLDGHRVEIKSTEPFSYTITKVK